MSDETNKTEREMEQRFPSNNYTKRAREGNQSGSQSQEQQQKKKKRNPYSGKLVTEKKKTVGERIADTFLDEEVRNRFIADWVFPGIDTFLGDILHSILLALFGDKADPRSGRGRRNRNDDDDRPTMRYHRSSDDDRGRRNYSKPSKRPQLVFRRKEDAEKVKRKLYDDLDQYDRVSLKSFYNYVEEVTGGEIEVQTDFPLSSWGWFDLSEMDVVHDRDGGWLLDMPKAVDIRR